MLNKDIEALHESLQVAADDLLSAYIISQAQPVEEAAAICPAQQVRHESFPCSRLNDCLKDSEEPILSRLKSRRTMCHPMTPCTLTAYNGPGHEARDGSQQVLASPDHDKMAVSICRSFGSRRRPCAWSLHQPTWTSSPSLVASVLRSQVWPLLPLQPR